MPETSFDLPPRYGDARHLANGGMAAVYSAQDAVLGRRVAVKVLAAHFAQDPAAVARFEREARAAARLSQHPHVVTIYDVGEHGGRPYLVMELMEGGSLAGVLRAGPPPRRDALRWIAEAAAALDFAHEHGVIHRDVKPGNLLLDAGRRLGVADFGIARLVHESAVTQTGQVLGTAAYIAPEQAAGHGASPASDRYSLAVVAHELLTGARPGPGGAADPVLARGLAADPGARWGSATAFAEALGGGVPDDEPTEATRPMAVPAPGKAATGSAERPRDLRRWLPVALVGLIALLVAVFALAGGGGDERAGEPALPAPAERPADRPREEPAAAGPSVAELNDRGFSLMNQGRYSEAIPLLQQAVERCGDSRETVCAYALFNLGRSLRLAGRPEEAIPILERRLAYDNQTEVVQAELDAARGRGADDDDDRGKGKGRGKGKRDDD